MGYMGLSHWGDSDMAADFHYSVEECGKDVEQAVKRFMAETKEKANCYNTCGAVNIALVIEDGILDTFSSTDKKKFAVAIRKALATLDSMITERKDSKEDNIVWHVTNYKRMAESLSNWLKENK
jgi:hypothetical protein